MQSPLQLIAGSLCCIGILSHSALPAAQPLLLETVPKAVQSEYEQLLQDPGDLSRIYLLAKKAEEAALAGGEEASQLARLALRLYKRMLMINPKLGDIRLRLGELNFWLGRYATARAYLVRVIDDPKLTPAARAHVEAYLDEIDQRLSRHRIDGSLLAGLRHQSNANSAPPYEFVWDADDQFTLEDKKQPRSDQNLFASLDLVHSYDLLLQGGETIETQVSAYGAKQFEQNEVSTLSLDISSGVRIPLKFRGSAGTSIRPHALVRTIVFGGELFSVDVGGGLEISHQLGETGIAGIELQAAQQIHPNDSKRNGTEYSATLALRLRPATWFELAARPVIRYDDARSETHANLRYGGTLTMRFIHPALFDLGAGDWSTAVSGTWLKTRFEGPDKFDSFVSEADREDDRFRLRGLTRIPISDAWSVIGVVGYNWNNSNVAVRDFRNWEISVGVTWNF